VLDPRKESNAMKRSTTSTALVPKAIVTEAWQEVGASFERFCLTAGIATLAGMMEEDAAELCGRRYGRGDGKAGYRWGKTKGKLGFHGGKVEVERPRVRAATARKWRCRAGKRPRPRTCSANGR
jgi:putative transposase